MQGGRVQTSQKDGTECGKVRTTGQVFRASDLIGHRKYLNKGENQRRIFKFFII